jgi:hypothetical protein
MLNLPRTDQIRWSTNRRRSLPLGVVLAAISFLWPAIGQASFLDCQEIRPDHRDQIVVGDVGLAQNVDRSAAQIAVIRLHQKLRAALADLISSFGTSIYPVPCPGHSPKISDYTQGIVQRRFDAGVLVEVWGVVSGTDADINYALLPLLLQIGAPSEPEGFYDLPYRVKQRGSVVDLFTDPVELRAFSELSAGLRAFIEAREQGDDERYRVAYSILCKANGLLAKAATGAEAASVNWDALRSFAILTAEKARPHTILKDLPANGTGQLQHVQDACVVSPPEKPVP